MTILLSVAVTGVKAVSDLLFGADPIEMKFFALRAHHELMSDSGR